MGMLWWLKLDVNTIKLSWLLSSCFGKRQTSSGLAILVARRPRVFQFYSAKKDRSKWRRSDSQKKADHHKVEEFWRITLWGEKKVQFFWFNEQKNFRGKVDNTMFCWVFHQFPTISRLDECFCHWNQSIYERPHQKPWKNPASQEVHWCPVCSVFSRMNATCKKHTKSPV